MLKSEDATGSPSQCETRFRIFLRLLLYPEMPPALLCLAHSYSPFKTQAKSHLLQGALPAPSGRVGGTLQMPALFYSAPPLAPAPTTNTLQNPPGQGPGLIVSCLLGLAPCPDTG